MAINLLNNESNFHFHFVCTNYGSTKDGIGHYTSKIAEEIKRNNNFNVSIYSSQTYNLSTKKLFVSFGMSFKILHLIKNIFKNKDNNLVILEYPFVEYNPVIILTLFFLKLLKRKNTKIIISLHEYSRTKLLRKIFIQLIVRLSDIVLYTREEDIKKLKIKRIKFIKRSIPANIEPFQSPIKKTDKDKIDICFFGIINYDTKEINNMLSAWDITSKEESNLNFHFISSTYSEIIKYKDNVNYYYDLKDEDVSTLLLNMDFMILPLKPNISINNGSLSISCIHGVIPVGIFDNNYFNTDFGIRMDNYTVDKFYRIYNLIKELNSVDFDVLKRSTVKFGLKRTIKQTSKSYYKLISFFNK